MENCVQNFGYGVLSGAIPETKREKDWVGEKARKGWALKENLEQVWHQAQKPLRKQTSPQTQDLWNLKEQSGIWLCRI